MKVAIFTGSIGLHKKNPDVRKQYILERLKYFTYDDISLEIITPFVDEYPSDLPKNTKYSMYKFINKKHLKTISTMFFPIGKLVRSNCELIHCYTHQAATMAWLTNYLRKKKYFIIFEPMGLAYEESKLEKNSSIKVRILRPVIKYAEKLIFQRSNTVAVYTSLIKSHISKEFDIEIEKINVIPHGVNLNTLYTKDKKKISKVYGRLNTSKKNKTVLYAGSLSELHGTPYLMKAIEYINKERKDVLFLILGRGELENSLKNWIKEKGITNVHLLGFVPSEDIFLYLDIADILVIPHAKCMQTELDQPTKLFEYLASGKPIVSFNLKAIVEVVGSNAILVEPDNPEALANGILSLVDDKKLCRKLGEKGKTIVKNYSWEASAKNQYDIYVHLYENEIKK